MHDRTYVSLLVYVGRDAMRALLILAYMALASVTGCRIAFAKVLARSVGK